MGSVGAFGAVFRGAHSFPLHGGHWGPCAGHLVVIKNACQCQDTL